MTMAILLKQVELIFPFSSQAVGSQSRNMETHLHGDTVSVKFHERVCMCMCVCGPSQEKYKL